MDQIFIEPEGPNRVGGIVGRWLKSTHLWVKTGIAVSNQKYHI